MKTMLEGMMLSAISQAQRDKYCKYSIICKSYVDLIKEELRTVVTRGQEGEEGEETDVRCAEIQLGGGSVV